MSVQGYSRSSDVGVHPLINIFNATKRLDKQIDGPERSYDTFIAMLKFAHEIVINNEFIFDQYPNERYVKTFYNSQLANINKSITKGAELLRSIQIERESPDPVIIRTFLDFIKSRKSQSLFYSTFIDDLFTFIFQNILDTYDKMIFIPELIDKKWEIGTYLLKIIDILLQKFLVNLDRALVISENPPENYLLIHATHYLNNSRVVEFILKTLEVIVVHETNSKVGERFNSLGIENKLWFTYVANQNGSDNQAQLLKRMIVQVT